MACGQIFKKKQGSQKTLENGKKSIFQNLEMEFSDPYPLKPMSKFKYPKSRDTNLQFEVCINFLAKCPNGQRLCEKGHFWPERHVWPQFSPGGNIFPWIWPPKWFLQPFLGIKHSFWAWANAALIKKNYPEIGLRPIFYQNFEKCPTNRGTFFPYPNHHEKLVTS